MNIHSSVSPLKGECQSLDGKKSDSSKSDASNSSHLEGEYQSLHDKKSDASNSRWVCWRINEDMWSGREAEHQAERQSIGVEHWKLYEWIY